MEVTEEVAGFAARLAPADIPAEVLPIAVDHVLDSFGVMLAGCQEDAAAILRGAVGLQAGPAAVIGTSLHQSPSLAALSNGIAGHALDYDDTQLSTSEEAVYGLLTHPSVPVLAAASAVAAETSADGAHLLAAYVAGVEVACRIADAINARHYQAGFHTTGTVGSIGAAAAAGNLYGLEQGRMAIAIGIAASSGSGLRENFGTMTKPLHAGRAAFNGVLAAALARDGFTASSQSLEAPRGFFQAAGGGYTENRIVGRLGQPFFLLSPGISIKPYPSGSLSHPAQDLILELVAEHDLVPDDVASIEVGTNSNVPNALIHHRPSTGLQGKFSLEYCMATGVIRRRAGLAEFTDAAVREPEIQAFLPRVRVVVDPDLEERGFRHVRTRVRIQCTDGRSLQREAEWARGYPTNPLPAKALDAKFVECAERVLPPAQALDALQAVRGMASAERVTEVLSLLQPPAAARRTA